MQIHDQNDLKIRSLFVKTTKIFVFMYNFTSQLLTGKTAGSIIKTVQSNIRSAVPVPEERAKNGGNEMPKLFRERKINARDVVGLENFRLCADENDIRFCDEKLDKIVKKAEAHLEYQLPVLPATVYLEYKVNGNRSHYQDIYFKRRTMALELALAEAYENKGRFTGKLLDVVWAIMEESSWIIPAHLSRNPTHSEWGLPPVFNEERLHGIDLFSACTSASLSLVYMLCRDKFDAIAPLINEKLLYMLKDRTTKPYLNCVFGWSGERGNSVNNWCPWITSNVLMTVALTEPDLYTRKKVVEKALSHLDNFTDGYKPDGGCDEGPGYWGAAGAAYFDSLELLYDMTAGKIDIYVDPLVKAMMEYIVKFNIYERRFINFADCSPICHHDGIMIRRMGEKCGSESLKAFGDKMASVADGGISYGHCYRGYRNLIRKTPEEFTDYAETKIWFPDLKVMAARESNNPGKGMFVAMKGGNNNESHNHNDVGNVVVYYDGNPVIIDTGAGEYTKQTFSAERYKLWFMQSAYHNVADIGEIQEKNGAQYASCDEVYDSETGGVRMEISNAYPAGSGLESYVRETVLKDGKVHIKDSIRLSEPKEVDFHFMSCEKPTLIGDGRISLAMGRTLLFDGDLKPEIEEFEVGDIGIEKKWHQKVLYRIHLRQSFVSADKEFIIE